MLRNNKREFVEVVDETKGKDAVVVEALIKNSMDVKYKQFSIGYTYYRLRATRKETKTFTNQLKALGYNYITLRNNKYLHVRERTQ